jgi:hypothetical protein
VISGLLVGAIILGLLAALRWILRQIRACKSKPRCASRCHDVFWLGIAIGVYLLGLIFYVQSLGEPPSVLLTLMAGSAALYAAVGWGAGYALGR